MCLQRAFRLEQSREQYFDVLRAMALPPPSPLSHLCQEQIFSPSSDEVDCSFICGRKEAQPLNQHFSICPGIRSGGRWFGHIHVVASLQYAFNVKPLVNFGVINKIITFLQYDFVYNTLKLCLFLSFSEFSNMMKVAHICTPHGLGHVTRQLALISELEKQNIECVLYCHCPEFVRKEYPNINVHQKSADVGIIQQDALHIDIAQTCQSLEKTCSIENIDSWAKELEKFDLVIADIPPLIFAAAAKANVPVLGMGNFDWIWIYQHFSALSNWTELFLKWQEGHYGIQINPGTPLNLNIIKSVQWIARKAENANIPSPSVLIGFGGLGIQELEKLPKIPNITWIHAPPTPKIHREDFLYCTDQPFTNLVHSADVILSKAGYGILAESQRSGTPQIWIERPLFPEAHILELFAREQGDMIITQQWGSDQWKEEITNAVLLLSQGRRPPKQPENDLLAQWLVDYSSTFGS